MSRPCRWPDGGCGADIIDVLTVGGAKQVLDAQPEKRIVMVTDRNHFLLPQPTPTPANQLARVVDTYVDHHATCPKWAAKVQRERQERAGRP